LPANCCGKDITRFRFSVLPLADAELPAVVIVHWLFCKNPPDDSNIGDPLA
jgi:hypothetical protein